MEQRMQENTPVTLSDGQIIQGKNNGFQYRITNKIKSTINESTYLCQFKNEAVKLVVSKNKAHMIQDISTLQLLDDIKNFSLSPQLLDVDQYIAQDQQSYYFYVTKYRQGKSLCRLSQHPELVYLIMLQLLEQLEYLHEKHLIVGQLVADQIVFDQRKLMTFYKNMIRPMTIGYPLRLPVSIYDRSYWGLGSRLAEPSYDLFSIVILILNGFYRKPLDRTIDSTEQLLLKINELPLAKRFKQCLIKALFGKYPSAAMMKKDIIKSLTQKKKRVASLSVSDRRQYSPSILEINCLIVVALFSFGLSFCLI